MCVVLFYGFVLNETGSSATAAAFAALVMGLIKAGLFMECGKACRAKFRCGKAHGSEYSARIVAASLNAFFVGHAVFGRVDEQLRGTCYTDYREDAYGNGKISLFSVVKIVAKRAGKTANHTIGHVASAAATAARCPSARPQTGS